ncbi:MAG: hypothetical protein M1813_005466 [Trichoglossum hirsutum]|jgi:superfamily I DNA and/or RNA helicase|nr:MAG: hypothetical protein M1813_005466 [Trichoglossum hirsutum]
MLPSIADWPNREFYNGQLINDESTNPDSRPLAREFSSFLRSEYNVPQGSNRIMLSPIFRTVKIGSNGSLTNIPNMDLVISTIKNIVQKTHIRLSNICIISLYELQRLNYMRVFETAKIIKSDLHRFLDGVTIATLDSFQGRESEIIIIRFLEGGKDVYSLAKEIISTEGFRQGRLQAPTAESDSSSHSSPTLLWSSIPTLGW